MFSHLFILAATDDNTPKVIFGLVVFALWAISAVLTQAQKKKEQERRQRVRDQLERGEATLPPPPPIPQAPVLVMKRAPQRPVQRSPKLRQPAAKMKVLPVRRKIVTAPVAVPPRRPAPPPLPPRQAPVARMPVATPAAPPAPAPVIAPPAPRVPVSAATASTLRAWLRPGTMRQQFILTEVLQPPLALRE